MLTSMDGGGGSYSFGNQNKYKKTKHNNNNYKSSAAALALVNARLSKMKNLNNNENNDSLINRSLLNTNSNSKSNIIQMQTFQSSINLEINSINELNKISQQDINCNDLTINNIENEELQQLTNSQLIKLNNLDYLYQTKVPSCFNRLRCRLLDWILLRIFPMKNGGKFFLYFLFFYLLHVSM